MPLLYKHYLKKKMNIYTHWQSQLLWNCAYHYRFTVTFRLKTSAPLSMTVSTGMDLVNFRLCFLFSWMLRKASVYDQNVTRKKQKYNLFCRKKAEAAAAPFYKSGPTVPTQAQRHPWLCTSSNTILRKMWQRRQWTLEKQKLKIWAKSSCTNLSCFSDCWLNAKGTVLQLLFPVLYIPQPWDS